MSSGQRSRARASRKPTPTPARNTASGYRPAKREKSPRVSPALAANCCACRPASSHACSAFRAVADANCWPASWTAPATPATPPVGAPAVREVVPAPRPRSPALAMMHLLTPKLYEASASYLLGGGATDVPEDGV